MTTPEHRALTLDQFAATAAEGHVPDILAEVRSERDLPGARKRIVGILRSIEYNVADLLADISEAKSTSNPEKSLLLDRLLEHCIRRTALTHETAIETMLLGFCELDVQCRVLYANRAFLELLPGGTGRRLVELLGEQGSQIEEQLHAGSGRQLRRFELRTSRGARSVLAEYGAVTAVAPVRFHMIIADLTENERAERSVHDRAEFGILKLNAAREILYANAAAGEMLQVGPDALVGHNLFDLAATPEDEAHLAEQARQRDAGISSEYDVAVRAPGGGSPINVRVRSIAETDADGNLTGIFLTLSPIDIELAIEKIQSEMAHASSGAELFRHVAEILRPVIPFNYASLAVFTPDRAFSRRIYIAPDLAHVNVRWILLPESLREANLEEPIGRSMRERLMAVRDRDQFFKHEAVQEMLRAGVEAWLTVPVQNGEFDAVFTLLSCQAGLYDESDLSKLERIGVANAMRAVLRLEREREEQFRLDLIKSMAQQSTDMALAELVVHRLCEFYGWQNVSIFKVNRFQDRVSLLCQAAAERDGFLLPEGYEQGIDEGIIGETVREEQIVLVGDTLDPSANPRFKRVVACTRAELCIPIHVQGCVTWVLNLEDRRAHAFTEVDRKVIEALIRELEPSLERALGSALLDQVLDDTPDAVVITDVHNNILKCNKVAREMLKGEQVGATLSRFFAPGSAAASAIESMANINVPVEATVLDAEGGETAVLLRARVPRDEYDRRIVVLQDREKFSWHLATHRLIDTLAELAAEVRIPLSLASTFLNQIRRSAADDSDVGAFAQEAIEQLARVDLSYERVINHAEPVGPAPPDLHDIGGRGRPEPDPGGAGHDRAS